MHSVRPLLPLCAIGVTVRFLLLLLAGEPEFQADESNYLYLAYSWNHFGLYPDGFRYLWPPGYPFLLAQCLAAFGESGPFVLKLAQVIASASTGLFTMLFARRLYGLRAAKLAGIAWAFHLPLAAYTHYIWTESLFLAVFLPALYLVFLVLHEPGRKHDEARLLVAGLLFAVALYLKASPLYLAPVLALALAVRCEGNLIQRLRPASLFLLAIFVAIVPWTLRNYEVYGRLVWVGSTLGENSYNGLNAPYRNFDLHPVAVERSMPGGGSLYDVSRPYLVKSDAQTAWRRPETILNLPDRQGESLRLGIEYVQEHPAWFARSRVKKVADLFIPLSFYVRHHALKRYDGMPLGQAAIRRATVIWALTSSVLVMLLGVAGAYLGLRRSPAGAWVLGSVLAYTLATSLLVSMSRFRIPIVPILIVFGAGLVTERLREAPRGARVALGFGCALMALLWWINLPETGVVTGFAMEERP